MVTTLFHFIISISVGTVYLYSRDLYNHTVD